ncbi:hypothetical protein JCM19237_5848 [Photobacterium aphoticum]|uniref:Uncharacterized protein n=1 Tax=Photobacterium aphoticum TaxID=754436 RepID=A0A090QIK1_9GAMM|nr:hypothetical protein JCM19237_5848 [Photobacterium aphoticum]
MRVVGHGHIDVRITDTCEHDTIVVTTDRRRTTGIGGVRRVSCGRGGLITAAAPSAHNLP